MSEGRADKLADWFGEIYKEARAGVDLAAYRALDDTEDDYQTRLAAKRKVRQRAGASLMHGMMRDADNYMAILRKVARVVLEKRLKRDRDEARVLVDGQYAPVGRPIPTATESGRRADSDELALIDDELEGLPEYSSDYLPTATLAAALFEMLDDPVKWGEWVCATEMPNTPIALVIKRFAQRMMDWLAKHTRGSTSEESYQRTSEPPTPSIASLLDESSRHYVAGMLDVALLIKERGESRQVSSLSKDRVPAEKQFHESHEDFYDEADQHLYAEAIAMLREYLAVKKKRTSLQYRAAYALRKLFPEHAWAVQDERVDELEPIQSWTTDALGELRNDESDEQWAAKQRAIDLRIDHERHWSLEDVELSDDHACLLDLLALRCTRYDTHLPQSVVGVLVGVIAPEVLRKATEDPSSDAYDEFRRGTNKLSTPLKRLNKEVTEMMEEHILLPLQAKLNEQGGSA